MECKYVIPIVDSGVCRWGSGGLKPSLPLPEMGKIVVENGCYFRRLYFLQQLFQKYFKIPFSY